MAFQKPEIAQLPSDTSHLWFYKEVVEKNFVRTSGRLLILNWAPDLE
jgi:hypothetical protein